MKPLRKLAPGEVYGPCHAQDVGRSSDRGRLRHDVVRDGHITVLTAGVSQVPGARVYSDLVDAVADNPAAVELAHKSRVAARVSMAIAVVGLGCEVLDGISLLNGHSGTTSQLAYTGCALGAVVASLVPAMLARSYANSAITLYNEVPPLQPIDNAGGLSVTPRRARATLSIRDAP
jgi:hypothetical protein